MLLLEGQIVLLVDRRATIARSPVRFLGGLAAASPFSSASAAGCVHAFEIPLTSIRGLDYSNPLCLEGRLVLETSGLRKREFATVRRMGCGTCQCLFPCCRYAVCVAACCRASLLPTVSLLRGTMLTAVLLRLGRCCLCVPRRCTCRWKPLELTFWSQRAQHTATAGS
jgi:hypothetical protein